MSSLPSCSSFFPLSLFGPHTIFSGNEAEFSAPFQALIPPVLAAGAVLALALTAFALVLPRGLFRSYVALLFGLGLVIWIQGNFLVADYGPLDGTAIDWTRESWRNPYEIAMWIAVPVLCVAATRTSPASPPLRAPHSSRFRQRCSSRRHVAGRCALNGVERPSRFDVRLVAEAEHHSHRARRVPVRLLLRDSGRGPDRNWTEACRALCSLPITRLHSPRRW